MFPRIYFPPSYFSPSYFTGTTSETSPPMDTINIQSSVSIQTSLGAGIPGSVLFVGPGPALAEDSGSFSYDPTAKTLTVGAASISATAGFAGPASGLTNLNPAALAPGTAPISITGSAANVTGVVGIANGGTGQTTAAAALNALLPNQAGHAGQVLTTDGNGAISWSPATGGMAIDGPITGGTAGSVLYVDTNGHLAQDSNLRYDATNHFLGVNTNGNAPAAPLHVENTANTLYRNLGVVQLQRAAAPGLLMESPSAYGGDDSLGASTFYRGALRWYVRAGTGNVASSDLRMSLTSSALTLTVALKPASMTDAAAPNGTLYFSTTRSKLCFKDTSGTINSLY